MFSFFDDDFFALRDAPTAQWYNGGAYLVYQANHTSH